MPQYAVPVASNPSEALELTDPAGYRQDTLLGWPQHKVTLFGALETLDDLWLSASVLFLSERWGFGSGALDAATGELLYEHIEREPAQVVASVFVTKRHFAVDGLSLVLGVHNVTDQDFRYVEGYAGSHAPSPAPSRELFVRLAWDQTSP